MAQESQTGPRSIVERRLLEDLGAVEEIDVRSAVICGELGCDELVQDFISRHPRLRCPFMGRVDDPAGSCERLRREYRTAIKRDD